MKSKLFFILLILFSCTKENKYQYEVNPVDVTSDDNNKTTKKSNLEFISIAYADLFGTSIPQNKLINISTAYNSFGDQKLIEERIIASFLTDPAVQLPSSIAVNGDTTAFVENVYRKLYNRYPSSSEKYFWLNTIRNSSSVNPSVVYYSLMTSDEYRFY